MRPNRKEPLNPYGIDAPPGGPAKENRFFNFFLIGKACRPRTAFNTLRGRFLGTARIVSEAIEEEFFKVKRGWRQNGEYQYIKYRNRKGVGIVGRGDILIIGKDEEGEKCFLCAWCNAR